jgi:uncharacterized protein (TIGR00369 family)
VRRFIENIPHNKALGMEVLEIASGSARFALKYDAKLIGNPDTGMIHGGVITAMLDACSGAAVFSALPEWVPIATLDLRIDYLRGAEPRRDIKAHATCYRVARHVAFTRAVAYHDDEDDPIASSVGTFMLSTKPAGSKRS